MKDKYWTISLIELNKHVSFFIFELNKTTLQMTIEHKSPLTLLFLLFTTFYSIGQCMQQEVPFDYVPLRSEVMVEGTIVKKEAFWGSRNQQIFTKNQLKISRTINGNLNHETLQIITLGGQIGNRLHTSHPELQLNIGDQGVFLLNEYTNDVIQSESKLYRAWAIDQSYYRYDPINNSASTGFISFDLESDQLVSRLSTLVGQEVETLHELILSNNSDTSPSRVITNITPSSVNAGVDDVITITGSGFGATQGTVFFRSADSQNPGSFMAAASEYVSSWSNTQVIVRVPPGAGTGKVVVQTSGAINHFSPSDLNILYNISSFPDSPLSDFVRYVSTSALGNVTFQFNSSFSSNTAAKESFLRAMQTWKCTTDIHWIEGADTGINVTTSDGVSVIRWSTGDVFFPVLGQYNGYFSACTADPSLWNAAEFDITFITNGSGVTWEYGPGNPSGGETDFETVALHEIGHALILGHVSDPAAIMYPAAMAGATNRLPGTSATSGALFSMPLHQSPADCSGQYPLTPLPGITITNASNNGLGSLRKAVEDSCPDATLTFAAGLTNVTIPITDTPLSIDKNLEIHGLGMNNLTLSGQNAIRIFDIQDNVSFTLKDLKLQNGYSATNGGAFYNMGTTILENILFQNNHEGGSDKAFTNDENKTIELKGNVLIEN